MLVQTWRSGSRLPSGARHPRPHRLTGGIMLRGTDSSNPSPSSGESSTKSAPVQLATACSLRWHRSISRPAKRFSAALRYQTSGACPARSPHARRARDRPAYASSHIREIPPDCGRSSTRINRQGWLSRTDGARQTSSSNFATEPCGSGSGETGAHHAARLATRAAGRGKRHRMQARTAPRSRFNSHHNTAPDDQLQLGSRRTAERHRRARLGLYRGRCPSSNQDGGARSDRRAFGRSLPLQSDREPRCAEFGLGDRRGQ
jgi:hypothetical protein